VSALGCNLARGIIDTVLHCLGRGAERGHRAVRMMKPFCQKFRAQKSIRSNYPGCRELPPRPLRGRDRTGQKIFAQVRFRAFVTKREAHDNQCSRATTHSGENFTAFNSRRLHQILQRFRCGS